MTTENEKYQASLLRYLKRKKEHPHAYSEECKRHYYEFPLAETSNSGGYSKAMENAIVFVLSGSI